jgi:hypothetical protein
VTTKVSSTFFVPARITGMTSSASASSNQIDSGAT